MVHKTFSAALRFWLGIIALVVVVMSYTAWFVVSAFMSLTISTALGFSIFQAFLAILSLVMLPLAVFIWAFWDQLKPTGEIIKSIVFYFRK